MPRAHTAEEVARIRERLLQTGADAFVRSGLARVTIAELARAAGIGKGSFYRFFESKEDLFSAIQEQQEAAFKRKVRRELEAARSPRQAVVMLLMAATTRLDDHPFLRLLLDPQTLATLMVRLSPEQIHAHREADRDFFVSLAHDWKQRGWLRPSVDPQTVFEVLGAMFVLSVQREVLGEAATRRAITELAEAVADRWCP